MFTLRNSKSYIAGGNNALGHETFKALLPPAMYDLLLRSVNIYRELYLENQELKRQLGVI